MEKKNKEAVQIIPLGGVEEIGINCTAIRYKDKIIVIDMGMGFSDVDHLGVDYLIPNHTYLKHNKDKIEGIFITHGHLDHIGAIDNILPDLGYPDLFASPFAMELIKRRLDEAKILNKAKLHQITADSVLHSEPIKVSFFHVNHSIPESMGVIVDTPVGKIVHSGDFKFDNSPLNEETADFHKMSQAGEEGVKLLLSDSTNSFKDGYNISESVIQESLDSVIASAKGRVIVSTFASLVTRLYALVEIAKKHNRKVFITGRSMQTSIEIARKLNYINAPDKLFVDRKHFKRFSDQRLLVLATGSQGESMAAMSRMARGDHYDIKLKKGDTVVLSSSIIPGNDLLVQNLIDEITAKGAEVYHKDIMNVHTSGHGFVEDQKLMINLFKPELFMPVHGYQYFLRRHAQTAQKLGIKKSNTIITKRGDVIEISKNDWEKVNRVKHNPILISADSGGEVRELLLQDREQLAGHGIVALTLVLKKNRTNYELINDPHIMSRGFVFVKQHQDLMGKISSKVKSTFNNNKKDEPNYRDKLRREIEKSLGKLLYDETQRKPFILVSIEFIT
jgi:ribonuclease J